MKSLAAALLFFTSLTFACYDDSLRCVNPNGSTEGDYTLTVTICNELNGDMCYCAGWAEDYCTVLDQNAFNQTCLSNAGFAPRQCAFNNPFGSPGPSGEPTPSSCGEGGCGSSPTEIVSITVTQSIHWILSSARLEEFCRSLSYILRTSVRLEIWFRQQNRDLGHTVPQPMTFMHR
jgi:hypothetical protein